LLDLKRTI
jgi:hypothetical protein